MERAKVKAAFVNLCIIATALAVSLVLAEGVVRFALPKLQKAEDRDIRIPDPKLGYRYIVPNKLMELDANGFKNHSIPDHADIVALGDSHTQGILGSIEKTWPYDLASSTGLSVYNMGLGGYGPVQYYALTDLALSFKPKYLIVGLLFGNDFFDAYNMVYNGYILEKSEYDYHNVPYVTDYWKDLRSPEFKNDTAKAPHDFNHAKIPFEGLRVLIRTHSALYNFLADRTYIFRERLGLAKPHELGTLDWTDTDPDVTLRFEDPKIGTIFWVGQRRLGVDVSDPNIIEGMRITKMLLQEMQVKALKNGTKLIVALIPTKEAAYAKTLGSKIDQNPAFREVVDNEAKLREDMQDFCKRSGIVCADLLPELETALQNGERVYPEIWDGHPAAHGYDMYAESIRKVIQK